MNIYLCGQKYFGQETLKLVLRLGHTVRGVSAPRGDRLWRLAEAHAIAGKARRDRLSPVATTAPQGTRRGTLDGAYARTDYGRLGVLAERYG